MCIHIYIYIYLCVYTYYTHRYEATDDPDDLGRMQASCWSVAPWDAISFKGARQSTIGYFLL